MTIQKAFMTNVRAGDALFLTIRNNAYEPMKMRGTVKRVDGMHGTIMLDWGGVSMLVPIEYVESYAVTSRAA